MQSMTVRIFVQLSWSRSISRALAPRVQARARRRHTPREVRLERRMGPQPSQFVEHLRQAGQLRSVEAAGRTGAGASEPASSGHARGQNSSKKLWELTDLSANEFTDEAARFFGCERVTLQELLAGASLAEAFAPRFLRETLVYPYSSTEGHVALAIADPSDQATRRAAEIVLGPDIAIAVASFEDLAIVLDRRLAEETAEGEGSREGLPELRDDDIESL